MERCSSTRSDSDTPGALGARVARRRAFATRRRLIVAFSVVVAAFLSALGSQLVALRRMEAPLREMRDHAEEMRLVLDVGSAVRDQYALQEKVLLGDRLRVAEYERARERALASARKLAERLDEPAAVTSLNAIRVAAEELDRRFRGQLLAVPAGGASMAGHAGNYGLVSLIEGHVDRIFLQLQAAGASFREQLSELEEASFRWTAALLLAAPVFVAGVVLYLSRSVARPLARLSEGAAALAAGDLGARIAIDTPDEFGALAEEFNAMTLALRQHQERLLEAEKLAGIGRLAAGIAHEINNPLQVMLGYVSLNRGHPDPRLAEQLEAIEAEALRCRQVVDGLLDLSRPSVEPAAPVELRELCEDVASGLRATAMARGSVEIVGAARALGSAPKLRQVVFNLLKNAVEAAGPSGRVEIRIVERARRVELAVCDDGPGIPADTRARLFEPFFTTKADGTGLGLAVSRAIALAHGGDIDMRDGDLGGATFTLRLPGAPAARS